MGKTKKVHFGISETIREDQPSINRIFPVILSEMVNKFVAKGLKFEFDTEWDDFDKGFHFYRYEVDENLKLEAQVSDLLSSLTDQGIKAILTDTEKSSSYEKYLFGQGT